MKSYTRPLSLCCILCIVVTFIGCVRQDKYLPNSYTKDEVKQIYNENAKLFENIVDIVSSNENFYDEGRINEFTDADIVSPHDDALMCFSETERHSFDEIFAFKPYMIRYDYARRFVDITFIASDGHTSYSFLFWTSKSDYNGIKFNNYKDYLEQKYTIENIAEWCIMYY